jgi:hypothetical protein
LAALESDNAAGKKQSDAGLFNGIPLLIYNGILIIL